MPMGWAEASAGMLEARDISDQQGGRGPPTPMLRSSFSQMVLSQLLQLPRLPELTPPSALPWRVRDLKERGGSPHVNPEGSDGQTDLRRGLPPNPSPADCAKHSPDPRLLGRALPTAGMAVSLLLRNSTHAY